MDSTNNFQEFLPSVVAEESPYHYKPLAPMRNVSHHHHGNGGGGATSTTFAKRVNSSFGLPNDVGRIISIDVGIRHLAICVVNFEPPTTTATPSSGVGGGEVLDSFLALVLRMRIEHWILVDLLEHEPRYTGANVPQHRLIDLVQETMDELAPRLLALPITDVCIEQQLEQQNRNKTVETALYAWFGETFRRGARHHCPTCTYASAPWYGAQGARRPLRAFVSGKKKLLVCDIVAQLSLHVTAPPSVSGDTTDVVPVENGTGGGGWTTIRRRAGATGGKSHAHHHAYRSASSFPQVVSPDCFEASNGGGGRSLTELHDSRRQFIRAYKEHKCSAIQATAWLLDYLSRIITGPEAEAHMRAWATYFHAHSGKADDLADSLLQAISVALNL
jgi:hypothetical protein